MSTYIYGITSAKVQEKLPDGMGGVGEPARPVRILTADGLAAVVSDAPEDLRPKRRDLLAHQSVLAEAGTAGTVLPMRFGSLAPDDGAVTEVLGERAAHYAERLQALEGHMEYNLKATHHEEAVLHQVLAENPEIRTLTEANRQSGGGSYEQRLQLGELVVSAVQAREAADAVHVQRALEPLADAIAVGPESTGWLANISFLVDRKSADGFVAAVEELRRDQPHLDLKVNGPLPPYSFVEPGPSGPAE